MIVGRPGNPSTIFNRLTGLAALDCHGRPGITRDRIYGKATWQERTLLRLSTPAEIVPDGKAAIPREILRQAQMAIEGASLLLLVVDVRARADAARCRARAPAAAHWEGHGDSGE